MSLLYYAAGGLLIMIAAFGSALRVQRHIPLKWLLAIAAASLGAFGLIWVLLVTLAPKSTSPPTPAPDYSALTGSG